MADVFADELSQTRHEELMAVLNRIANNLERIGDLSGALSFAIQDGTNGIRDAVCSLHDYEPKEPKKAARR